MFLNVCKQIFYISHLRLSQKVKGVLMWNLQHNIFIWKRRYLQISKSALVHLYDPVKFLNFVAVSPFLLFWYYNYPIFEQWKYCKVDHVTQVWILCPPCLSWFSSAIYHKRKALIISEREIKNEEGRQKSFPSDVEWVRNDLYQIATHLTSRLHTHPPNNVNLTFVVVT